MHVPPLGPVYPALHRQLVKKLLPLVVCEFPGQLKQESTEEAARVVEYVPASQSRLWQMNAFQ